MKQIQSRIIDVHWSTFTVQMLTFTKYFEHTLYTCYYENTQQTTALTYKPLAYVSPLLHSSAFQLVHQTTLKILHRNKQCLKWDGMRRYAIPALPWTGINHTGTSVPRNTIPVRLNELSRWQNHDVTLYTYALLAHLVHRNLQKHATFSERKLFAIYAIARPSFCRL